MPPTTTIATITIVLVFASLNILSGMNGAFFHPIAFNVPVAIGASLAVAYDISGRAEDVWVTYAIAFPFAMIGKILIADRLLSVARYAGPQRFREHADWAHEFARNAAAMLDNLALVEKMIASLLPRVHSRAGSA